MKESVEKTDRKADRIDTRMWSLLVLSVTNLLGIATTLFFLLMKNAPAVAAVAK